MSIVNNITEINNTISLTITTMDNISEIHWSDVPIIDNAFLTSDGEYFYTSDGELFIPVGS